MYVLKDESVQFKSGWNMARSGGTLSPDTNEEAVAGYHEYFLEHRPTIPLLPASHGYNSELAKSKRKEHSKRTYLKDQIKSGIK